MRLYFLRFLFSWVVFLVLGAALPGVVFLLGPWVVLGACTSGVPRVRLIYRRCFGGPRFRLALLVLPGSWLLISGGSGAISFAERDSAFSGYPLQVTMRFTTGMLGYTAVVRCRVVASSPTVASPVLGLPVALPCFLIVLHSWLCSRLSSRFC